MKEKWIEFWSFILGMTWFFISSIYISIGYMYPQYISKTDVILFAVFGWMWVLSVERFVGFICYLKDSTEVKT